MISNANYASFKPAVYIEGRDLTAVCFLHRNEDGNGSYLNSEFAK